MKFDTIYSLGSRCQNSDILKHYGYREFSGVFDFMNTKTISTLNHILKDKFTELFKHSNNLKVKCDQLTIDPETREELICSYRTMNKFYNKDLNNIEESIFPHHDLTLEKDKIHFAHCVDRFYKLKQYNVLFNYTYNTWENLISLNSINEMISTLEEVYGFSKYRVCFIAVSKHNNSKYYIDKISNKFDVWSLSINTQSFTGGLFANEIDNLNYLNIINTYNINKKRISKEDIDILPN